MQSVTPDARSKTHFIIVDAVGVCEHDKTDSVPMERKGTVSLEQLLQAVALGNIEDDVLSSIAGRLARLDKRLTPEDKAEVQKITDGKSIKNIAGDIVQALNPDNYVEQADTTVGAGFKPALSASLGSGQALECLCRSGKIKGQRRKRAQDTYRSGFVDTFCPASGE